MSKNRCGRLLCLILFLSCSLRSQNRSNEGAPAHSKFGNIPLYFEENRGQTDSRARYIARGANQVAFITQDGLTLSLKNEAIAMRIVGAAKNARIASESEVEGVSNYYLGERAISGLRHYSAVRVSNIRPGIDIVYHGNERNLEYDLVIHPGANPEGLRFRFEGETVPQIADNGDLLFKVGSGELRQRAPRVLSPLGARRRPIECKYVLSGRSEVALQLSQYDRSKKLVVDPILSYSTYLSGTSTDNLLGIAADSSGDTYLTGQTSSTDFPVTAGTFIGGTDAFVTKLNAAGTGLIYSTFIGGSAYYPYSGASAIAIDLAGNAYLTGNTSSSNFPFTNGHLYSATGGNDAFVLKVGTTGAIIYATDLGGNGNDAGNAIAVDTGGAAYVAGNTSSTNFPATAGALRTTSGGSSTGFVAKISTTGSIAYATYLGGSSSDSATAIAVDSSGDTYIEGTTTSSNFPVTTGAFSATLNGNQDAFVAKLNSTGSSLVYATYLGGSSYETGGGLAIDAAGNCYATGITSSNNFPITPGAFSTTPPQYSPSWFVTKLNATGTALVYSTYLPGSEYNNPVTSIAVDADGAAYVSGSVGSTFPTTPGALRTAPDSQYGEVDLFLAKLSNDGSTLSYSTLLGTSGTTTQSSGLALDGNGGVYITGTTNSSTFPTTAGAFQTSNPKTSIYAAPSGFAVKIDFSSSTLCTPSVSPSSVNLPGRGGPFSFELTLADGCPWEAVSANNNGNSVTVNAPTHGVVNSSPIALSGTVAQNNNTSGGQTLSVVVGATTFTVNQAAGSCQDPVLSLGSVSYDSSGGIRNLNLVLPSQCSWTAVSSAPWLSITASASGTGPATITIFAGQNSFSQRSATLTIDGSPVTVTQTGSGCTDTASGTPLSFSGTGGTGVATITTSSSSCSWSAYSTVPWIQMVPQTGNGQGSAPFLVAPNPGSAPRIGHILIADQTLTVNQSAGPVGSVSSYTMSVYAGGGSSTVPNRGDGGPATSAYLNDPQGVAFDKATGNLYIVDVGSSRIRVVTPDGNINTFAGGGTSLAENVPALSAQFVNPQRVAVDSSSSVYFDDSGSRVRKISNGMVATFAGTTSTGFAGDTGPATSAQLWNPAGIAADSLGNVYIADESNNRIRQVSAGNITTFAGGGSNGLGDGGPATSALLSNPSGVAVDVSGNVYIADYFNGRVRKVSDAAISTLASVQYLSDVAVDPLGNVFAAVTAYGNVTQISPSGTVSVVTSGISVYPNAITADASGNVYFSEPGYGVVDELTPAPTFCSYAASNVPTGPMGGAGGIVSISVTAAAGCNWTAYSGSAWATISSGASGTGNGTVQLTIAANTAGPSRTGSIVVAGHAFLLTQTATGTPSGVSITPSSGSAASQTFALQYSDTAGAANLQQVWVYFNGTLANPASNACLLYYNVANNQISLLGDNGTAWQAAALGNAGTLQNSQCSINVASATVALSGETFTWNVPMTFKPAFAGAKNTYVHAVDLSGTTNGWQQLGSWTVGNGAGTPAPVSVTPSSGSGASQTFALQYSDTAGGASLQQVWAYFSATLANPASNACLLYYNIATNQINLLGDNGTAWQAATLGSGATLQNSQCSINVATATVALSGNTFTLNLPMTFQPAYAGTKDTYLRAIDISGTNSGWQQLGSWTVSSTSDTPAAVSVTPSSGSGANQTFALVYSDPARAASLRQVWVYFNATLANPASNACLLYYSAATNQISLLGDNGTAWQAATLGSAATLQNSQCSINVAEATVGPNGNTLTWNVPMTFKPAYAGAKHTYLRAIDISGAASGWQQEGAWTVSSASGAPAAVSVTPSSGSAASQTFALQYSDTAGAASLQQVWAYFNATLANPASNACLLYYSAVTNQISLLGDNGTAWQAASLGSATTLQNSQCSIDVGSTTVTTSGNTLTLNVPMTFQPAYAGAKNTYLYAMDELGSNSGWQREGGWTVP